MKLSALILALSASLFLLAPAHAQEKKTEPRAWLDSRGVLTLADLEKSLGTTFNGAERTKMEALLAERNAALTNFNDRINSALREKLAASSDAEVAAKVAKKANEDDEAAELERIRRRQPRRYQAIMAQKRKDAEKQAQKDAEKKDAPPTKTSN